MAVVREEVSPPLGAVRRYSGVAMTLHWLLAAAFAFQLGLGWRMDGPRGPAVFAAFQLHKSVGITILALSLIRLAWRLTKPAPAFPATMTRWEKGLAHAVHVGFYVLLIGLPLTGWLLVSASRTGVPTLLYGTIPFPHVPGVPGLAAGPKQEVSEAAEFAHHALVYIAYLLIFLHLAGAIKHQFVERGSDLERMLPAPRRSLGVAIIVAIAALFGIATLGKLIPLAPIAQSAPPAVPAPAPAATEVPPVDAPAPDTAPAPAPAPAAESEKPAGPVEPSVWTVRKSASTLGFHTNWSQGAVNGRFKSWDAAIRFDPDALDKSSVSVTIDMASATTGVSDTENALPGSDWFDVAGHPKATFAATSFKKRGGDRYEAQGTLTLRGASRPLALPFTLRIEGDVATMSGTATIDRVAFGVGQGDWATTSDVPANVSVTVAIKADRKK